MLRIFRPSYPGELTDFRSLIAAGFLGRCDIHYGEIINCHNYEIITLKKSHFYHLLSEIELGEDLVLTVEPGERAGRRSFLAHAEGQVDS